MIAALQAAISGLTAISTRLQANGNNIANSDSEGYLKTRVTNASQEPQGVRALVDTVTTPGPVVMQETGDGLEPVELSNVDLAGELVDMNLNKTLYQANLTTIRTVDEMTGSLLRLKA